MEIEVKNSATGKNVTVSTANPMPVSISSQEEGYALLQTQFVAIAAKAGYAIGDFITRLDQYNNSTVPPTFLASTWLNNTQGTTLASAPPAADITVASGAGLALDGTDATGITPPTGGVGIRGWLSGIYNRLAGVVLAAGSATVGNVGLVANSSAVSTASPLPVRVVDVTDTTPLPISGSVALSSGNSLIGNVIPFANSSAVTTQNPMPIAGTVTVSGGTLALTAGAANVGNVGLLVNSSAVATTNPIPVSLAQIGTASAVTVSIGAIATSSAISVSLHDIGTSSAITISGTVTANIGTTGTLALDGTDATGVSAPTGGAGIRGWLSGIYNRLAGVVLAAGTATIGSVKLTDGTNTLLLKAVGQAGTPLLVAPEITVGHQKIHDGLGFSTTLVLTGLTASATTGQIALFALVTGSSTSGVVHLKPRDFYNGMYQTGGGGFGSGISISIQSACYEAPSSVTLGSPGTINNRNRNSANVSNCSYYPSCSALVGGTQIMTALLSPGACYSMGLSFDPDHEIILKPNTTYVFQVLNSLYALPIAGVFSCRLFWYEA